MFGCPKSHTSANSSVPGRLAPLQTRARNTLVPLPSGDTGPVQVLQHRNGVLARNLDHILEGAHAQGRVLLEIGAKSALEVLPKRLGIEQLRRNLHGAPAVHEVPDQIVRAL